MKIKINRVRVKNFRSLSSVETTLGEVTLLLGANNSGKTSFLRALTIALTSDRKFISRDDLFINKAGKYPANPRVEVDVEIKPERNPTFSDEWAQVFGSDIQIDPKGEEFFAYRTVVDFSAQQSEAQIKRYIIKDWDSGNADENEEVTANISKIPLYFIDAQRDLQEDLKFAQSYFGRLASRIEYDDTQKEQLEEELTTLNQKTVEESPVLKHLKTSLEELNKTVQTKGSGVEITPFPKRLRDLHKGLKVNFQDGGSETFSLEYHGMGTRSWASLLGYKAYVNWIKKKADDDGDMLHPVLALEEPEAHLHPNAQRQVYGQLKNVTGQKIISTHSPYIAPLAGLEELRVFYKADDSTSIADLKQLANALSLKEKHSLETQIIRARGELFFARFVVLFEGQTEEGGLPVFAKKHWGCEAFEKGVSLMECSGDTYRMYIQFLDALRIPWIIFSDYDNPSVQTKVNKIATYLGVDIHDDDRFVLLNASIEDYIISEGYREEIENALFKITEPTYANEQHKAAKVKEREAERENLRQLTKLELLDRVASWKAKIAPLWAQSIVEHTDPKKQIPLKIRTLFTILDEKLQP
ncbi:MAG: AAA family ATPase [bacterium]|nr:AAA family ATPase [bacterium]